MLPSAAFLGQNSGKSSEKPALRRIAYAITCRFGLWRKTSLTLRNQNRMIADLTNFAARLRNTISVAGNSATEVAEFNFPRRSRIQGASFGFRDETFTALAVELFALQFAANPAYRKACAVRGAATRSVSHWKQIPAVPTVAFKEFEITCLPPSDRPRVFHSSGTTEQQPSRHFHIAESLAVYETSLWLWFDSHVSSNPGCDDRLLCLTPPPAQAPNSSLVHMFETVRRNLGAEDRAFVGRAETDGAWTLDFDATRAALLRACRSNAPLILLGTAFSFVHLLDWLGERNLSVQLPPGSRVMETGGYKGRSRDIPKAELHALITQRLGVTPSHIVCEYGMSELSSQAYDHCLDLKRHTQHATRIFHFPPWVRVQITSPETGLEVNDGETGLIRVFDLANVFSVLAIQTEDLAIRRGDGFELIGRAALTEPRGCSLMMIKS